MQKTQEFCFSTLALGKKYRNLASLLAKDILQYSPGTLFIILTDVPSEFNNFSNVLAFQHHQQSVGCYHDKRYVIKKTLELFDCCIFMDADMRILENVPENIKWSPGITARSCCGILKHLTSNVRKDNAKRRAKKRRIVEEVAKKLDLETEQVKWVNEFLWTIKKCAGKELIFLNEWERIGNYFELNGLYGGEGFAIGLAAAKAELPIFYDREKQLSVFKDKAEKSKIKNNQIRVDQKIQKCFEDRKKYEKQNTNYLLSKSLVKILRFLRSLRLVFITLKDWRFYYTK